MNHSKITLTAIQGNLIGKEYVFEDRSRCVIGRAEDCDIQVPMDNGYGGISRHHCMLEIDPPDVRARDLGSRNGTFVNGKKIGQRPRNQLAEEADLSAFPTHELKAGDEVQVGHNVFLVGTAVTSDLPDPMNVPLYFV